MCAGEGGSLIRLSYNKMSESRPRWVYIYAYRGGEKTLLRCRCTVGERKEKIKWLNARLSRLTFNTSYYWVKIKLFTKILSLGLAGPN